MKLRYPQTRKAETAARSSEAGVGMIEFALLLPVLLLFMLGTIDFARVFYDVIAVANAARVGATYGSQSASKAADLAGMRQAAQSDLSDLTGTTVTAAKECRCSDNSVIDCDLGTCGSGSKLIYAKVTVAKTFTTLFPYPGIPSSIALSRTAEMRAQ